MNKKLYILPFFILLAFSFIACGDDDDDNTAKILAWKSHQDQVFNSIANSDEYKGLKSLTGNGSVYYKISEDITNNVERSAPSIRLIEIEGQRPLFTDSVLCRYIGWYLDENNKKIVFDGTENMVIDGTEYNFNKMNGIGFMANGVIAGWTDLLTNVMRPDDEYEVCIPHQLAYGSGGAGSIPYYTTLFFKMKLLRVYRIQTTDDDKLIN